MCELVCDLQQLTLELHDHEMASRTRRIAECESGLTSLRAITATDDLLDRVCKELVRSCGFGRALLSKVEDGMWQPWMGHFSSDMPEWFDTWLDTRIPLDEMTLETRLLTERRPELVHDTLSMRGVHDIVHDGQSSSYVVAPVMPAGKVVGLLHADHHPSSQRADEADRDVLWAFAEGFGHIYERTVLLERMRSQREEVRDVLDSVERAMEQLCVAEFELAARPGPQSAMARTALSVLTTMSSQMEELTPREAEVLELMVAGATNGEIADKLVITEGTVKSHVKHILRKLGAVNRSQAIAHYLGVSRDELV
jgi:DNA-binding CsgD family transcriptional regulator